jgi:predicted permease
MRVFVDDAIADAAFALRTYRRKPAFAVTVIVTLALAVGASTALFSIIERVLLRSLPYSAPNALVSLTAQRATGAFEKSSYPEMLDWRAQHDLFSGVEAYDETNIGVELDGGAQMLSGARVTPGFFSMLGVAPIRGRSLTTDDDNGAPVVLLTHDFWSSRMAQAEDVVGHLLRIDGSPYRIIGVLPSDFRFAPAGNVQLWLPLDRNPDARARRDARSLNLVARLRDGVSVERARLRVQQLMRTFATRAAGADVERTMNVISLREEIVGAVRRPLLVLFGAVAVLLLIACANIASLVLARTTERERELAVRSAIGAGRWRLSRQILVENLILALAGGIFGLLVASVGVSLLTALIPPTLYEQMPALHDVTVDRSSLVFALVVVVLGGLAFGLAPVLIATRAPAAETLRSGTGLSAGRRMHRLRRVLITGEIALTTMLLVAAGLLGRSLMSLLRIDTGFDAAGVATVRAALSNSRYPDPARQASFFAQVLTNVRAVPGVQMVGAVSSPPLQGSGRATIVPADASTAAENARMEVVSRTIAGDYFRTLRVPIREGRTLDDRDAARARRSIVISANLARQLFSTQSAIGRAVRFEGDSVPWTVVGVVGDVKTGALDAQSAPTLYRYYLQAPANRMSVMARTATEPSSIISELRRTIHAVDAAIPLYSETTLRDQVQQSPAISARRYPLLLIGTFALSALVLAIVGVYGLIAYAIAQRRREIAIRLALGARDVEITTMFLRDGLRLLIWGVVIGGVGAMVVSGALSAFLFDVRRLDAVTYISAILVLAAATCGACYIPARRASALDPALAFRAE